MITISSVKKVAEKHGLDLVVNYRTINFGNYSVVLNAFTLYDRPVAVFWISPDEIFFSFKSSDDCIDDVAYSSGNVSVEEVDYFLGQHFFFEKRCRSCEQKFATRYCDTCMSRYDSLPPVSKMFSSDVAREMQWWKDNTPSIDQESIDERMLLLSGRLDELRAD